MGGLLEWGADWLEQQRTRHLTKQVVYQRDADSVQVGATVGKTVFALDDGMGGVRRIESRDFLILAAELVLAGEVVLPEAGDRIRESQGGRDFIYEVMAPGTEPPWRYSDAYRRTLRIHAKEVEEEPTP